MASTAAAAPETKMERKKRPPSDNVRVCVRCRPFSDREKKAKAELVVTMDPYNPDDVSFNTYVQDGKTQRKYGFDYSIWSHDNDHGPRISNGQLYDILGRDLLEDFIDSFNVCLFAYGQSGSGKTYSMLNCLEEGKRLPEADWGLVPRIGRDLCAAMKANNDNPARDSTWELSCTFLEIYREEIKNLLVKDGPEVKVVRTPDPYQKGRQKNQVMGVSGSPVKEWADLFTLINTSQVNKTTHETGLNARSSRAHSIFEMKLVRNSYPVPKDPKENLRKENSIRLVDLAGSERIGKTQATGVQALEGKAINLSLMALGKKIKEVGEISNRFKDDAKRIDALEKMVGWNESKLLLLLRDALTGNCRTVMIAAVSPADTELEETRSTLGWADEVKKVQIKTTKVQAQLTPLQKTQAELKLVKEELENLKKLQGSAPPAAAGAAGPTPQSIEQEKKIAALQAELQQAETEKLEMEKLTAEVKRQREAREAREKKYAETPYLALLAGEPGLTRLKTFFVEGSVLAGVGKPVEIYGVKAMEEHAVFANNGGVVSVAPIDHAFTLVNGRLIDSGGPPVKLAHNDRVVLGHNNFFVFQDPRQLALKGEEAKKADSAKYTYAFATKEGEEELIGKAMRESQERQAAEEKRKEAERKVMRDKEIAEQKAREEKLRAEQAEVKREAEKERKEFERLLKQQEAEKKALIKLQEEELKRAAAEQAKLSAAQKQDSAEKARMAADAQRQQDDLKKQLAELKQRQDEARLHAEDMQRKFEEQTRLLKEKEEEEQRRKGLGMKRHEQRELARQRDHARWDARLRELVPMVTNCNEMCVEMGIDQTYAIVPISEEDEIGAPCTSMFISVQRAGVVGQSLWDDDEFVDKLAEMKAIYAKWEKTGKIELPKSLRQNPFVDTELDVQPIGRSAILCEYLHERIKFDDRVAIIDHQGRMHGRLLIQAEGWIAPALEAALPNAGNEMEFPSLRQFKGKTMDIQVSIEQAINLSVSYQQNVYVTYKWPRFTAPEAVDGFGGARLPVQDDNFDRDSNILTQRTIAANTAQPFTVSPVFGYKKTFRFLITDDLLDWLHDGSLQFEVYGSHGIGTYGEDLARKVAALNKEDEKAPVAPSPRNQQTGALLGAPVPSTLNVTQSLASGEKRRRLEDELRRAMAGNVTKEMIRQGEKGEQKLKLQWLLQTPRAAGMTRQQSLTSAAAAAAMPLHGSPDDQLKKEIAELKQQVETERKAREAAEKKAALAPVVPPAKGPSLVLVPASAAATVAEEKKSEQAKLAQLHKEIDELKMQLGGERKARETAEKAATAPVVTAGAAPTPAAPVDPKAKSIADLETLLRKRDEEAAVARRDLAAATKKQHEAEEKLAAQDKSKACVIL